MVTINQLRMEKQRKGHRYNAGVAVKQPENTEKQQFVLQYRGNISNEFVKKLNKIHHVQTIFSTRILRAVYLASSLGLIRISNPCYL